MSFLANRNVQIFNSTMSVSTLNTSAMAISTLTGSTMNASSINVSTLSGSTLNASTMTGNRLTISTLTVSSINNGTPGVAAYSTFNASSINVTSTMTTSTLSTLVVNTGSLNSSGNIIKLGTTVGNDTRLEGGTAANSGYVNFLHSSISRGYIGNANATDMFIAAQNGAQLSVDVGGTRRLSIDTSGNIIQAGGIFYKNSATANSYMTMNGGDANNSPFMEFYYGGLRRCYIGNANASSFELYCQNNADLNIWTGGSLRMKVSNGGNVGIGVASPSYALDVAGSARATSGLIAGNGTGAVSLQLFDLPTASWQIATGGYNLSINNNSSSWTNRFTISETGNVGIGVAAPSTKLHIYDSSGTNVIRMQTSSVDNAYIASTYDYIFISANYNIAGGRENTGRGSSQIVMYSYGNSGGLITFNTSPSMDTFVQERMRITSTGNVGIGITNPSSLLHVAGNIYSSTNISAPSIGASYYGGGDQRGVTNYFKPNSQPAGTFTVGFYGGSPNGYGDGIHFNSYYDGSGGNQNLVLFQKSGIGIRIYQGGWQSASSYSSYADVSLQAASDIRLKENIQDISDARGMIDILHPKTFYFIKDENKIRQIGFIAQEVRNYYPQFVTGTESETQYLSMEYGKMSPIAIAACKDLYVENDVLKARIDILESRLAALERSLTK